MYYNLKLHFFILAIGVKINDDGMHYLVEYKDSKQHESFPSETVRKMWPQLLIRFFEKRILWQKAVQFIDNQEVQEVQEADNPIGDPVGIDCKFAFYIYPKNL